MFRCEAAYASIPVIAFCDTDSPLENVDVVIPSNNKAWSRMAMPKVHSLTPVLKRNAIFFMQKWVVGMGFRALDAISVRGKSPSRCSTGS